LINAPTNCPCCRSTLEWSNDLLYCRNTECSATNSKQVEHFASSLKIKGLGPSTIQKLSLSSILDIYALTLEDIVSALGSEKLASKLFDEITQSQSRPLNLVIPAFGIPLIGKTASDKLSKVCSSISDITAATCKEAGLGEKATNNLLTWLESKQNYEFLPFSFKFDNRLEVASSNTDPVGIVCISGKLNSYPTKQQATVELEKLGFIVKSDLTKDVTILVNESGKETAKTKKASISGVLIVTDLKKFIGEYI
jgi:DNA ligase (NAD+)